MHSAIYVILGLFIYGSILVIVWAASGPPKR
jgi:hypothetical protein